MIYFVNERGKTFKITDKEYVLEWVRQFLERAEVSESLSLTVGRS